MTLYSAWLPCYDVTFDPQFEGAPDIPSIRFLQAGSPTLGDDYPVISREGYEFAGWFAGPGGKGQQFTPDTPITRSSTLYAKWLRVGRVVVLNVWYDDTNGYGGFFVNGLEVLADQKGEQLAGLAMLFPLADVKNVTEDTQGILRVFPLTEGSVLSASDLPKPQNTEYWSNGFSFLDANANYVSVHTKNFSSLTMGSDDLYVVYVYNYPSASSGIRLAPNDEEKIPSELLEDFRKEQEKEEPPLEKPPQKIARTTYSLLVDDGTVYCVHHAFLWGGVRKIMTFNLGTYYNSVSKEEYDLHPAGTVSYVTNYEIFSTEQAWSYYLLYGKEPPSKLIWYPNAKCSKKNCKCWSY